ncbi:efflux RND transporter permease subunit [Alienimonas californiensis]|uniref:Nickel and cobalt resistance protein CnrA n=1 Tax=Alienimonas californiensis TaxID=2527989 RepID=A0A517P8L8_9PLAN|nr:efflux RND transporter permease subunit [Alienimonas californiensis]QDT15716.1 Nickel and cobalt resistance protein CnrA [Alienimonas californiensis]
MLNAVIRTALRNRAATLALAAALLVFGGWQTANLPIDVFPDLDRPRVVVLTEAPGMAPEEVEALITFPLETTLNGATGVEAVRSSSGVGISVINVEFAYGTDIYTDRQIVTERIAAVADRMPEGVEPSLAPVSSIMGQVLVVALWADADDAVGGDATDPLELRTLADWVIRQRLLTVPGVAQVFTMGGGRSQFQILVDPDALRTHGVTLEEVEAAAANANRNATGGYLDDRGPTELLVRGLGRATTVEDLRLVPVATRGGVPVTLGEVATITTAAQVKRGDSSAFVRVAGEEEDGNGEAGDAEAAFEGGPAVALTITKQPGADTRAVTAAVDAALADLAPTLPADVRFETVYSQRSFIDRAVENVAEALADGGALVVVILFAFLLNLRTTLVTLTAIPLSVVATASVFAGFDLGINTMTLGGLAVAVGELVDDAIVDVENVHRRLKENRLRPPDDRLHPLRVVYGASAEIRGSIVYGTAVVVLVFLPLFALQGMEGRLFAPLAAAYVVSILASLAVSLTVTPVLCSLLLIGRKGWLVAAPLLGLAMSAATFHWILPRAAEILGWHALALGDPWWWTFAAAPAFWLGALALDAALGDAGEGPLLRGLQWVAGGVIRFSTVAAGPVLLIAAGAVIAAGVAVSRLERDFLPPFNEGAVQVNVLLAPGTSLKSSGEIAEAVEKRLMRVEGVRTLVRRTGRAELDEHAEGVNVSEIIVELDPEAPRERVLFELREAIADVPGAVGSVEGPLAHLISHMISGVKAQVGIKLYGDDLDTLRRLGERMQAAIGDVPGLTDVVLEPQVTIPQLRIELDRPALARTGLQPGTVMEFVETAMNGAVVSEVLVGQRTFDLLVRLDEPFREDIEAVRRLAITAPDGAEVPLGSVADIYQGGGPNTINRENVRRRIVLQANVADRGLVDAVTDVKARLAAIELPPGYFIEYSGQFESQQSATNRLAALTAAAVLGVFLVLNTLFRSANFALQVMAALPAAFVGGAVALVVTDQTLTVAALVGFISLAGIASRNGILLLSHYLHLVREEGEDWTRDMLVRAGRDRLAPVLMTALTSGIGLVPLALSAGEPGKEILYPVATVIVGGLISSTAAEFVVRPALFWAVGRGAGRRLTATDEAADPLA